MPVGDVVSDRKTETDAGARSCRGRCAPQRDAQIGRILGRQPAARVGDFDDAVAVRGVDAHVDAAAARRAADRVLDQVIQRLREARGVAGDRRRVELYEMVEFDLLAAC